MATPWQPFSGSLGACAYLSSSFSLQVRARAFCEEEERIVLSFGIFWSVFVTMPAIFSAGDSRKDVLGGWTFLKQLPTARRASFLVARSRHRRGSVKSGTFGFHDHVNEASKVFLRHFLCCASTCFRPVAFRENQMLIWTFFGHMWSDVHWCLSLLVFLSPVEDGGWLRSRSQKRQRRTDILRLLGTFVSFFLKKKESLFFNKDSFKQSLFFNKDSFKQSLWWIKTIELLLGFECGSIWRLFNEHYPRSAGQWTDFKSWAVMGFSIAHQCPPVIDFVCVAMAGSHTWKGSITLQLPFDHIHSTSG